MRLPFSSYRVLFAICFILILYHCAFFVLSQVQEVLKKIVGNWCTMYCTIVEILYAQSFLCFSHITGNWIGVHLTLFIHPSKVWSMLHHTSLGMSSEYLTQTPTLNLSLPLLFFIIKFVSLLWFLRLIIFTAYSQLIFYVRS